MNNLFEYSFIVRGFEAGIIIAIIAPLIGIFLVLRRYSLMADTLAHTSLVGVALGLLTGLSPLVTAVITATASSVIIERLRHSKRIYGESALALFLSGSLAIAIVLINLANGFKTSLFSYLFGSIVTVQQSDLIIISILGVVVVVALLSVYKELVYISFDEESAQVSGLRTRLINQLLIILAAVTIAIAIPIVGILLISALIVIPVVTALQLKKSFKWTLVWAEIFSVSSVVIGIIAAFYLHISAGAAIILSALSFFIVTFIFHNRLKAQR
ncbi:MAG: metal ABC transporter permease [Candidatus Kerfeldbacteria bacterium]|nr:metal ABC transporter permease [Candidatus Kerfeldbacteria bacterium]